MGRTIVGVIVGYFVMALLVFVMFTVAYLVLGTERAFKPNSFDVSTAWLACSFVLGLVGAMAGGFACARVARKAAGSNALALLVLVLGLLMAIPVLTAKSDSSKIRSGDLGNIEAMKNTIQPVWVALVNPFVAVVGVLVGARMGNGRSVDPART